MRRGEIMNTMTKMNEVSAPLAVKEGSGVMSGAVTAALFAIVCLVWATTWFGIKVAIESIPPLTAAGVRFLIAFPIILGAAKAMGQPVLFPRKKIAFFAFITIFYFSVPYFLMNYGEQFIAPRLASLIFSSMPIFSLIFSVLLLRTRVNAPQLAGIVMSFAGFALIFGKEGAFSQSSSAIGIAALSAAVIMHGFCYVFTKRYGTDIGVLTYTTLPIGLAGLMMTAAGLSIEPMAWSAVTTRSWIALGYLALAAPAGLLSYFYLLKKMPPVVASFVYLIFPVLSILIDTMIAGAGIDFQFILFTACILTGFAITKFATPR